MTNNAEEAYQAGIDKLHVTYKAVWVDDDRDWIAPDLRQDPAFAWRVQTALLRRFSYVSWSRLTNGSVFIEIHGWPDGESENVTTFPASVEADALYTAVCALGREDSDGK